METSVLNFYFEFQDSQLPLREVWCIFLVHFLSVVRGAVLRRKADHPSIFYVIEIVYKSL